MTVALSASLLERLRTAAPAVALTGAGVSAESGLATFRGPGGLWRDRDPASLATPEAFAADPLLVWEFYDWRRFQASRAEPNAGHRALAAMEASHEEFLLVTQNVDGLHERAGSRRVVRLHGSLWTLVCPRDGTEIDDRRPRIEPLPPRCPCGAILRPGVVWFGEPLPAEALARAHAAVRRATLVLVVGTSSLVYPAAALPELALRSGAYVVEVNPEPTSLSPHVHERLRGPSGEILPLLAAARGSAREAS